MQLLGNLIWVVFGGALIALLYYLAGFLMCLSIIGIPFGLQLFKLGTFALWPFGHELVSRVSEPSGISIILNLLWILVGWWEIALLHAGCGIVFCLSIIGIPFGLQHFKLAIATIFPFGKEVL
ncbi:MAG: YccF domain-containing protein [Bacteroidales bacterium]|nr:YccF domain-containing protein [Bacteroidales bacterium]